MVKRKHLKAQRDKLRDLENQFLDEQGWAPYRPDLSRYGELWIRVADHVIVSRSVALALAMERSLA